MLSVEELNDKLIELAFSEDIGDGDHTTLCCIPADAKGEKIGRASCRERVSSPV